MQSLLKQNRLLDGARIALTVARLERAAQLSVVDAVRATSAPQDALYGTLHALLRQRIVQSADPAGARALDEGRTGLDAASALEAIVAAIVSALDAFDRAGFTAAASDPLGPVELLLQFFRLQTVRHPGQGTEEVLDVLRKAVAQHPRGKELLQMISNTTTNAEAGEMNAGVFDAPLNLRSSRDRSSRAPFVAMPYDELEMHGNDSNEAK